jgi:hypothetical protein
MPGFDGTGPRGRGPFSGKGSGFCILQFAEQPNKPSCGYAGRAMQPISTPPRQDNDPALIRHQAQQVESMLRDLRARISRLEAEAARKTEEDGA